MAGWVSRLGFFLQKPWRRTLPLRHGRRTGLPTIVRFHRICNPIPPRAERPAGTEMGWKRAVLSRHGSTPRCAPRLDELNKSAVAEGRPRGSLTGVWCWRGGGSLLALTASGLRSMGNVKLLWAVAGPLRLARLVGTRNGVKLAGAARETSSPGFSLRALRFFRRPGAERLHVFPGEPGLRMERAIERWRHLALAYLAAYLAHPQLGHLRRQAAPF